VRGAAEGAGADEEIVGVDRGFGVRLKLHLLEVLFDAESAAGRVYVRLDVVALQ